MPGLPARGPIKGNFPQAALVKSIESLQFASKRKTALVPENHGGFMRAPGLGQIGKAARNDNSRAGPALELLDSANHLLVERCPIKTITRKNTSIALVIVFTIVERLVYFDGYAAPQHIVKILRTAHMVVQVYDCRFAVNALRPMPVCRIHQDLLRTL